MYQNHFLDALLDHRPSESVKNQPPVLNVFNIDFLFFSVRLPRKTCRFYYGGVRFSAFNPTVADNFSVIFSASGSGTTGRIIFIFFFFIVIIIIRSCSGRRRSRRCRFVTFKIGNTEVLVFFIYYCRFDNNCVVGCQSCNARRSNADTTVPIIIQMVISLVSCFFFFFIFVAFVPCVSIPSTVPSVTLSHRSRLPCNDDDNNNVNVK